MAILRHVRPRRQLRTALSGFASMTLLLLSARSVAPVQGLFGIAEKRFKYEGFVDMGALGLDAVDGMVAALGDLDGEQL